MQFVIGRAAIIYLSKCLTRHHPKREKKRKAPHRGINVQVAPMVLAALTSQELIHSTLTTATKQNCSYNSKEHAERKNKEFKQGKQSTWKQRNDANATPSSGWLIQLHTTTHVPSERRQIIVMWNTCSTTIRIKPSSSQPLTGLTQAAADNIETAKREKLESLREGACCKTALRYRPYQLSSEVGATKPNSFHQVCRYKGCHILSLRASVQNTFETPESATTDSTGR